MPTLGTLSVRFSANLSVFNKQIRRFTTKINALGKVVDATNTKLMRQTVKTGDVLATNVSKSFSSMGPAFRKATQGVQKEAQGLGNFFKDFSQKVQHYLTFTIGVQLVMGSVRALQNLISNIEEFERALRHFQTKEKWDIYCTGSNAELLSGELSTYLSGRYVEIKIFGLNVSESLVNLQQQIVCNYNGSLPLNISNVTTLYIFNDTGIQYEKAQLTLSKRNIKVDYILHCMEWDKDNSNCNEWEFLDKSEVENYNENSTHIWFNVSSFQGYGGGQLAYDFEVKEILFNTTSPIENNPIKVTVNVTNNGGSSSFVNVSLNVSIWNGSSWLIDVSYKKEIYVASNSFNLTNFTWYAKPGYYNFTAFADPEDLISESNETNNINSTNYNVSAWTIFYGYVNGILTIADNYGNNFTIWVPQNLTGNIYFADYDSYFEMGNLAALNGTNDLKEADEALNMTGFNDSISNLYDKNNDGIPDSTDCFEIADNYVCEVPIINSTNNNSGNFVTGILWDKEDGTEYDGSQDLIFVTKINQNKQGSYGTYDYEIRVPAYLRKLKGSVERVKIYLEIK